MISDSDELDLELKRSKMESCNIHTHTQTHTFVGPMGNSIRVCKGSDFLKGLGRILIPFLVQVFFLKET